MGCLYQGIGIMFNKINMNAEDIIFLAELDGNYENLFINSSASLNSISPYFLWLHVSKLYNDTRIKPLITNDYHLQALNLNDEKAWKLSNEQIYICLEQYDGEMEKEFKNDLFRKVKQRLRIDDAKKLYKLIINEKNIICGEFIVHFTN